MCHPTTTFLALQQAIPNGCTAKNLDTSQRQQLALQALAGSQSITRLAQKADVSRKFVYQQSATARRALDDAFAPQPTDDQVLFYLPVTKAWLRQLMLGLVLIGHSPLRAVVELLRDLFDYAVSLGTVFNVVHAAVTAARQHNQAQDLAAVHAAGHDEIFQAHQPVLVGVDLASTYCYLLSLEEHRDAETWAIRLWELQERGLAPDFVVADAGDSHRAAHAQVFPHTTCRSDHFHVLHKLHEVVTIVANRAYAILDRCANWQNQIAHAKQQGRRAPASCVKRLSDAKSQEAQAVALADDVALLARWLQHDVLALAGPSHAERQALYDFIVAELKARAAQAAPLLGRLATYLRNQRDELLAFAAQLDGDLAALAAAFSLSVEQVHAFFAVQTLPWDSPQRWHRDAPWRRRLGARYFPLSRALQRVRARTVRASSLVENLNSRLRSYFFVRRHLGNDYLALLQFFLNHRRYLRSEQAHRVGKSPAELLTGQSHPHWLEMLGYTRFMRN
jgi:hypothetical protein